MKSLALFVALFSSISAFAAEQCFQLSSEEHTWSQMPELLCLEGNDNQTQFSISLKTGLPDNQRTVGRFSYSLLERSRCTDCNEDVFGLSSPRGSVLNKLAIRFNGKRDLLKMKEAGTVSVGDTKFFYRSL